LFSFSLVNAPKFKHSYAEYHDSVQRVARALISLGFERHRVVSVIGFNSPEWFVADLAAIFAGGIAAGIYTTNGPEATSGVTGSLALCCFRFFLLLDFFLTDRYLVTNFVNVECIPSAPAEYVLEHSKSFACVVENQKQLDKVLSVRAGLPDLKAIVVYDPEWSGKTGDGVYSWAQFLELGEDKYQDELEKRIKGIKPGRFECPGGGRGDDVDVDVFFFFFFLIQRFFLMHSFFFSFSFSLQTARR
jgi:long-chain-fatty-acid--CoA ligase ACSBG